MPIESVVLEVLAVVGKGLVAQLVDGFLGMGFGTLTGAYLGGLGLAPAVVLATVHTAALGSGTMGAVAHTRFGNVHWRTAVPLGLAGAAGAFAGAWALGSFAGLDAATPAASVLFLGLGAVLVRRGFKGATPAGAVRTGFAAPAGLVGGFLGAVGAGWGAAAVPVLLGTSRLEPRRVVGSASVAQVAVSAGALAGLRYAAPDALDTVLPLALGLAAGGAVAAPFAAWLAGRLPAAKLTAAIGLLVAALHLRALLPVLGLPWPVDTALFLSLAAAGAFALAGSRRTAAGEDPEPERVEARQGPGAPGPAPSKKG